MLREKIQKDTIVALKAGDSQKVSVLRFLSSQINDAEVDAGRKQLSDQQVTQLINSQLKRLKESLESFEKGNRQELVEKTKKEITILKSYLPQQLSDEELEKEVERIISENKSIQNLGALIGICVKALQGQADGGRIAKIVKEKIA